MAHVLLRNNFRAATVLAVLASTPIVLGGLAIWMTINSPTWIITIFAWLLIVAGILLVIRQLRFLSRPRLACTGDELLVYLRGARPIRVPLSAVECFFIGQAPTRMTQPSGDEIESATVVVRLAERASEWHRCEVQKLLGHWCDGYIIIRGTWCEPLDREVVNRMNSELAQVKRALKVRQA